MPRSRRFRRALVSGSVLSIAALSLAGFAGYRAIFGRTADGALALIPSDAKAIFLVDLAPLDPNQAMVFRQIDGSLDETGLSKAINEGFMSINGNHSETASKIAPYLRRSGALALFDDKGSKGAAIIGLTDPAAVAEILAKEGKPQFWKGLRYWTLPQGGKAAMRVEGDWLIFAPDGDSLSRLRRVADGTEASAASNSTIQAARASLGGPANIEFLISPSMLPETDKMPKPEGWIVCAGEIRDQGLSLRSRVRIDPTKAGELAQMFKLQPLAPQLLAQLPGGAYGTVAVSQIGESLQANRKEIPISDHDQHEMAEAIGIDFDHDLIPALKGDSTLAAYPDADGGGIDGLLVIDDSHGATPGAAVRKFREHMASLGEKEEGKPPFVAIQIQGADEAWRLDSEYEKEMRKTGDGGPVDADRVMKDKTAVWAIAGGKVFASTNETLLRRAISGQGGNLRTDPVFARVFDGSAQYAFAADPARIVTGIRKTVKAEKMGEEKGMFDQMLSLFEGLREPLAVKASFQPDGTVTGQVVVPLDWGKTIRFIGDMSKKH